MPKEIKEKIKFYRKQAKEMGIHSIPVPLDFYDMDYILSLEQEKEMYRRAFAEMSKNYFKLQDGVSKLAETILNKENEK